MIVDTDIVFPDPRLAEGDVVAVGGDLSPGTLLAAYQQGIFPWFADEDPILWWSLNPRFVVFPSRLHVSKRLRRTIRKSALTLSLDRDFPGVINACREAFRPDQEGTWITDDMMDAYIALHELGYAHSVEARLGDDLVGGLYGVSLGGCFYGESMFHKLSDASKIAFVALTGVLTDAGFGLIDCQQHTRHLTSFGAVDMPRENFYAALQRELEKESHIGSWTSLFPGFPDSQLWRQICGGESP